jgi:alkyldihydroxyacetonephosphate synthase
MREKSFWGWGYADRYPDAAGLANLGQAVGATLGFEPSAQLAAPELGQVALAPPRLTPPEALAGVLSAAPEARIRHTYGRAYRDVVRGFHRDFGAAPDLVATPADEAEIARIFEYAADAGAAVVPFGGGTSVVGGVECPAGDRAGVISLDLGRLQAVLEVSSVDRLARIQAGALGPAVEAGLRPHGLTLRHFPQSFEHSTLGGWIATRAGGHFATLYTHIDDLVASIRMLSPAGLYATRTLPGSGAGPSPDRLALGSEGTLGVITEAVVRVRPRPTFRAQASLHFARFEDAVEAARELAQSGLYPSNCRLLDAREAALNGVAGGGVSVLIVAFESSDHPLAPWLERAVALGRGRGGVVQGELTYREGEAPRGEGSAEAWRSAFIDAPYLQSFLVGLGIMADTFETACPWSRFPELHAALVHDVRDAMKRVAGRGTLTCRFTHVYPDGPAPYYTFLCPTRPGSELSQWAEIKAAASEALLRHGATITHHHAVGRTHRPWYQRQVPAPFLAALGAAKGALDPAGILNPGVLVGDGR